MITKVFAQGFLLLLAISLVTCLSIPSVVAQTQTRTDDGDVNRDGRTMPADALCIFQRFLGMELILWEANQQQAVVRVFHKDIGATADVLWSQQEEGARS